MPDLLTIPRELRDEIYLEVLNSPLQPGLAIRSRKRISKQEPTVAVVGSTKDCSNDAESAIPNHSSLEAINATFAQPVSTINSNDTTDAGYYDGEESVRYPTTLPAVPTESLLQTNRQLRAEMQDTVKRSKLRYKIRIAWSDSKDTVYPTWISLPALSNRVDVLDVDIRIGRGKSTSLFSAGGDDEEVETEGEPFFSGLVLLQRFLERGVNFLSKKRARKMTVGLLALHVMPKDYHGRDPDELFEESKDHVDDFLVGRNHDDFVSTREERQRQDELMNFFAERIDRFSWEIGGKIREWDMKHVIATRDELNRKEKHREMEAAGAVR